MVEILQKRGFFLEKITMVYKSIYSLFFAYYTWSGDRIVINKLSNYIIFRENCVKL